VTLCGLYGKAKATISNIFEDSGLGIITILMPGHRHCGSKMKVPAGIDAFEPAGH
jgi:hypothetical protein